jgi:hypothetical protein
VAARIAVLENLWTNEQVIAVGKYQNPQEAVVIPQSLRETPYFSILKIDLRNIAVVGFYERDTRAVSCPRFWLAMRFPPFESC